MLVKLEASSLFSLVGKTAVLTGASGFLGRTFAETLLANGAKLLAIGRSQRLEMWVAEWAKIFGKDRVRSYRVDMYDFEALSLVLDSIVREEQVDILVNNAHELGPQTGFNIPGGSLEECSLEQWTRNLTGGAYWPLLTAQKLGKSMKARGHGSIINIATMYAIVAPRPQLYQGTTFLNPPGYSAAKAALLSFTRYVASFWGNYGIRANALVPGPFPNTEGSGPNVVSEDNDFLERLSRATCLGRVGRPDELAGALLFLASDASSFMTGQALVIDGGWTSI